jgi:gliding motility associated protien GldN
MQLKKVFFGVCALLCCTISMHAMEHDTVRKNILDPPKQKDLLYDKTNTPNRKPIPYTYLREADVMWSKRVWRVIDLREKMNLPLYYPDSKLLDRKSLFDVIIDEALYTGNITCFDNPATDDQFRYDMTRTELLQKLSKVDTIDVEKLDGSGTERKAVPIDITSAQVWKYWLKEDWFFDKERSVMEVRIIGICPLVEKVAENGDHLGADVPLFWIYFPEARPIFANADVYMRKNDAERRTLDDIFWKRMFSSYVRKESNVYDRGIYDYKTGLDQLLESDRVKNDIFTFEHDLWHF